MQTGTLRHMLALSFVFLLACGGEERATSGGTCQRHADCQLYQDDCCVAPGREDVSNFYARPVGTGKSCRGRTASCRESWEPPVFDPLAPEATAVCLAGQCAVIDLRADDATRCTQDSDCETRDTSCCPTCGSFPAAYPPWRALQTEADATLFACFPIPTCDPCASLVEPPSSYCAPDGHCAVR